MRRAIIIGLALLVLALAVITVAVFGKASIDKLTHSRRDKPTIMIVTSHVLEQAVQINTNNRDQNEQAMADQIRNGAPPAGAGGRQNQAVDVKKGKAYSQQTANDDNRSTAQKQTDSFSLEVQAMQESLDGKISQDVDNSGRFNLIAETSISDQIAAYAKENNVAPESLFEIIFGRSAGGAAQRSAPKTSASQQSNVLSHGVTNIAKKLKAGYTLVVTIGEPNFTWDYLPAADGLPQRIYMVAQPEVNCELFETATGRAFRFANQLNKPIAETVVLDDQVPAKGQILTKLTRLDDRISQAAARQVLALILDKISPARIVDGGARLVINRGANDGVTDGAIYSVKREVGDPIQDANGADLGRSRIDVGSIVVQNADTATSTVAMASGGPFTKGDIVIMAGSASPSPAAAAGPSRPSGVPNVAVDHITLNQADSPDLGEVVSAALADESRIAVLPRAELANLRSEAAHNGAATGDIGMSPEEGMRQSGYLVDGQCSSSLTRHSNAISIGGVSEVGSSSVRSSSSCNLHATAIDGHMIGAAQGAGGSPAVAARNAANALLVRILPVMGVAPTASAELTAPPARSEHRARPAPRRPASAPAADGPAVHF